MSDETKDGYYYRVVPPQPLAFKPSDEPRLAAVRKLLRMIDMGAVALVVDGDDLETVKLGLAELETRLVIGP